MKNELYSFETVASPAAPRLLPGLRGRTALPPHRPKRRRRAFIHRTASINQMMVRMRSTRVPDQNSAAPSLQKIENLSRGLDQPLAHRHHLNQRDTKDKTLTSNMEKVKTPALTKAPYFRNSHFPQFPLNTQNLQKSQYSRPFCYPNHTIPTPIPTMRRHASLRLPTVAVR
jgi:hypothetical protein